MKLSKRLVALALTGAMALGVSAGAVSFPDVDESTPEGEAIIKLCLLYTSDWAGGSGAREAHNHHGGRHARRAD